MCAEIVLDEHAARRGIVECPSESLVELRPRPEAFSNAWIVFAVRPKNESMLGKPRVLYDGEKFIARRDERVVMKPRFVGAPYDLDATRGVDPHEKLEVERDETIGPWTEGALASEADGKTASLARELRFLPSGLELGAEAWDLAGKGPKRIGIEVAHDLKLSPQDATQGRSKDLLLSVLREERHPHPRVRTAMG
jgi:hypothetical protein